MFWSAARLMPQRERLALHCLALGGYQTYVPRIRERRIQHGRKVTVTMAPEMAPKCLRRPVLFWDENRKRPR